LPARTRGRNLDGYRGDLFTDEARALGCSYFWQGNLFEVLERLQAADLMRRKAEIQHPKSAGIPAFGDN
jgi:hypothetical protein